MPVLTTTILAATALAGLGATAYGVSQQQSGLSRQREGLLQQQQGYQTEQAAAEFTAGEQKNITNAEFKQEGLRMRAMELDAKRNTLQVVRNAQQSRALSIAAATAQGAGFAGGQGASSGLSGGLAQVAGDSQFNLQGINQNLQLGRENFGYNADISQARLGIADASTLMARGQGQVAMGGGMVQQGQGISAGGAGFMSLGGQLVSAAGTFSNVAGSMGSYFNQVPAANPAFGNPMWGGGSNGTNSRGWF